MNRRGFLAGLLAAPIIVRPGLIMPIRPLPVQERIWTATEIHEAQIRALESANAAWRLMMAEYRRDLLFATQNSLHWNAA